jgi:hypothetical protein
MDLQDIRKLVDRMRGMSDGKDRYAGFRMLTMGMPSKGFRDQGCAKKRGSGFSAAPVFV